MTQNRVSARLGELQVLDKRLEVLVREQQRQAVFDAEYLESPPGNRLEKLKGDRDGQWSIRINDQWRLVFDLNEAGNEAHNVEIVDCH